MSWPDILTPPPTRVLVNPHRTQYTCAPQSSRIWVNPHQLEPRSMCPSATAGSGPRGLPAHLPWPAAVSQAAPITPPCPCSVAVPHFLTKWLRPAAGRILTKPGMMTFLVCFMRRLIRVICLGSVRDRARDSYIIFPVILLLLAQLRGE